MRKVKNPYSLGILPLFSLNFTPLIFSQTIDSAEPRSSSILESLKKGTVAVGSQGG